MGVPTANPSASCTAVRKLASGIETSGDKSGPEMSGISGAETASPPTETREGLLRYQLTTDRLYRHNCPSFLPTGVSITFESDMLAITTLGLLELAVQVSTFPTK